MHYYHRAPQPPLDAFVALVWVCRDGPRRHALERVLPTGVSQLIVNLKEDRTRVYDPAPPHRCVSTSGTVLTGVQSSYHIIDTLEQEYVAGVVFKPGGTAALVGAPADELRDADTPLELLWGRQQAAALREQLLECRDANAQLDVLEDALLARRRLRSMPAAVAFAIATFDQVPLVTKIGAVTDATGMSAKRFIESFKTHVGVSPKRYCRIRRFQRAVARAHSGERIDWPQVALDCGYYDQAHFIHEFRAFSGLTPTSYQASRTAFQNHVKFLQSSDAMV
jgi:AraC-like DNA-binding protein